MKLNSLYIIQNNQAIEIDEQKLPGLKPLQDIIFSIILKNPKNKTNKARVAPNEIRSIMLSRAKNISKRIEPDIVVIVAESIGRNKEGQIVFKDIAGFCREE